MSRLFELSQVDCARLLHAGVFGRMAFTTPRGPEVLPVNYTTVGEAILVRTAESGL